MSHHRPAVLRLTLFVIISGLSAVAGAQNGDETLEEVIVTSRAQKLYRVEQSVSARLPSRPLESSQSIQVINSQLIEDQGARTAQDLYRNMAAVTFFSYAGVTARGFRQEEIYFDGLRGDPYASFSVPHLFNVERLEFLKGPAGMLYGQSAPGGVFNYVTKIPRDTFAIETKAIAGTQSRLGGALDLNAPFGDGHAARAAVFYEDRDLPRHGAGNESLIADTGVKFELGSASRLTLQATRYDQELAANRLRGVPVDNAGNFLASRRWNHNEPTDFLRLTSDIAQARFDSQIGESLSLNLGVRFNDADESQQYHEPFGLFDSNADGVVDSSRRQFRDQLRSLQSWSAGANAIWSTQLGSVGQRVLVGADWFDQDLVFDGSSLTGGTLPTPGLPSPLSLVSPQYGATDPATYNMPPMERTLTGTQRQGAYLLDEVTIGRFIATAGVRLDRFEDTSISSRFSDDSASWRAGVVYRITDALSAFAQASTSFEPQGIAAQTPLAGGPFEPTEGRMFEGGMKWEIGGGRMQGAATAYRIVRSNVLQADPRGDVGGDGVNDSIAFGEVTSEGFELDLAADLTQNWVLTFSYAYNDTRITRDNQLTLITNSVGDRFANAPKNHAGAWTRYQFPNIGLAFALGFDYVDVRRSLSNQIVQPYFVTDASIIYEVGSWTALLRVNNLTDETYAASGFNDRSGHFPGAPFEAFVEISRRW